MKEDGPDAGSEKTPAGLSRQVRSIAEGECFNLRSIVSRRVPKGTDNAALESRIDSLSRLVFVGIYSARKNFEKRQAVRETQGLMGAFVLLSGVRMLLFCKALSPTRTRPDVWRWCDLHMEAAALTILCSRNTSIMSISWCGLGATCM